MLVQNPYFDFLNERDLRVNEKGAQGSHQYDCEPICCIIVGWIVKVKINFGSDPNENSEEEAQHDPHDVPWDCRGCKSECSNECEDTWEYCYSIHNSMELITIVDNAHHAFIRKVESVYQIPGIDIKCKDPKKAGNSFYWNCNDGRPTIIAPTSKIIVRLRRFGWEYNLLIAWWWTLRICKPWRRKLDPDHWGSSLRLGAGYYSPKVTGRIHVFGAIASAPMRRWIQPCLLEKRDARCKLSPFCVSWVVRWWCHP